MSCAVASTSRSCSLWWDCLKSLWPFSGFDTDTMKYCQGACCCPEASRVNYLIPEWRIIRHNFYYPSLGWQLEGEIEEFPQWLLCSLQDQSLHHSTVQSRARSTTAKCSSKPPWSQILLVVFSYRTPTRIGDRSSARTTIPLSNKPVTNWISTDTRNQSIGGIARK